MFRIYFSNNVHNNNITQQHINQHNALKTDSKQEKEISIFATLKNAFINPGETVSLCAFFHVVIIARTIYVTQSIGNYGKNTFSSWVV